MPTEETADYVRMNLYTMREHFREEEADVQLK